MRLKTIIPIFLILLLSLSVFGVTNQQSYTFDYQYEKYGIASPSSPFSSLEADGSDDIDLTSYGWGSDFYPKVCDIDNDGTLEVLSYVYGDENLRVLNYNFDTLEVELEFVLDVTDYGFGINDVVCLQGINENYNIVLVVTNSSTDVAIREYAWDGVSNLEELYEYIDDDETWMIPESRLGCYEGNTYYWCYYVPDYDSDFQLVRITNSVSDNTHAYGWNVTAVSLLEDGYLPSEIEDLSSYTQTRLMPMYLIDGTSIKDYTTYGPNNVIDIKDIGSDTSNFVEVRQAPLVTGSNEVVVVIDDSSVSHHRLLKFDTSSIGSDSEWTDIGEGDSGNIGPVVAGGMVITASSIHFDDSQNAIDDLTLLYPSKDPLGVKPFGFWSARGSTIGFWLSNFNNPMITTLVQSSTPVPGAPSIRFDLRSSLIHATDYNYVYGSETNYDEVCGWGYNYQHPSSFSGCYNLLTDSALLSLNVSSGSNYEFPIGITNVNGEKSVVTYESETGEFFYYYFSDLATKNDLDVTFNGGDISEGGDVDGFPAFIDLNDDGITELIISGGTGTYIGSSGVVYESELTIVENASFGYYEVNCESNATTNTTIKFRECLGTYECSYFQDGDPNTYEKVCSSCGGTQTYDCGDWSELEPYIVCSNLTTGDIEMSFDFYRDTSPSEAELTILLTNGSYIDANSYYGSNTYKETISVASSSCNIGDLIEPPDVSEEILNDSVVIGGDDTETTTTPVYEDADDLIDALLSGQNSKWKIILGICLVLGITFAVATSSQNIPPFVIGLTAVIATILATAIGLLPAYILILIIMIALILIVVAKMTGGE